MRKFILSILLVFSSMHASHGLSSGSNTVFLSVDRHEYVLAYTIRELRPNSHLYSYLQSLSDRAIIARIGIDLYRDVAEYAAGGYSVGLDFEGYGRVTMRYYPKLNAILGYSASGQLIVLRVIAEH